MSGLIGFLLVLALSQSTPPTLTGSLTGRVFDQQTNLPVAGARVMIVPGIRPPVTAFGPPPQAVTDQDGRFVFTQLAPGPYRVNVQKAAYAPLSDSNTMIQVVAGQAVAVDLALQKGAVIAGRILDPTGQPMIDARVVALRRPPPSQRQGMLVPAPMAQSQQTNDLGEFRVAGLPAGEYYLAASVLPTSPFGNPPTDASPPAAPKTMIVTTFYPGATDPIAALPVTVAAGAEVGQLVFTMQSAPAFRIAGVVVDEAGEPVAGAMVMVVSASMTGGFMGPGGGARSGADGRFVVGQVAAGSYRLMASIPVTMSSGGGGFTSWSSSTTSGSTTTARGDAAGGGAISGTVSIGASGAGLASNGVPATEVTVADADVAGVRVVVRRRPQ